MFPAVVFWAGWHLLRVFVDALQGALKVFSVFEAYLLYSPIKVLPDSTEISASDLKINFLLHFLIFYHFGANVIYGVRSKHTHTNIHIQRKTHN